MTQIGDTTIKRSLQDILLIQFPRYPGMQPDDLYKLIHQAAMGSEHAIEQPAAVRDYLIREIRDLPERSGEPLFEVISPDGDIARINLRPFVNTEGDIEMLLDAFFSTASSYEDNLNVLRSYLGTAP